MECISYTLSCVNVISLFSPLLLATSTILSSRCISLFSWSSKVHLSVYHYLNSAICRVPNNLPSIFFEHSTKKLFTEYKIAFAQCMRHSTKKMSPVVYVCLLLYFSAIWVSNYYTICLCPSSVAGIAVYLANNLRYVVSTSGHYCG